MSPPIIETLAAYYEFKGIRTNLPVSDPTDKADRPTGVLALAAAAVTVYFIPRHQYVF